MNKEDKDFLPKKHALYTLIRSFLNLFRYAKLYDLKNQVFQNAALQLARHLEQVRPHYPDSEVCEMTFQGDQIFVNGDRVIPQLRQLKINKLFIAILREKKVASMVMPFNSDSSQLLEFLWVVHKLDPDNEDSILATEQALKASSLSQFQLKSRVEGEEVESASLQDLEIMSVSILRNLRTELSVYFQNLELAKDFDRSDLNQNLNALMRIPDDEIFQALRLVSETELADRGVQSAALVMSWARSMGLPAGVLLELSRAAAFHPLLYIARKKNSLDSMSEEERLRVFQLISRLDPILKWTTAERLSLYELTEAHGKGSVYKVGQVRCYSHFYSRMLRIVCFYSLLEVGRETTDRMLPDEAMASLLGQPQEFDSALLKLFINWMGIYPVGSLVELQTGEIAQVFSGGSDPLKFQRPIVSVLTGPNASPLDRPFLADLSDVNTDLGVYRRSIRRSIKPGEVNLPENLMKQRPVGL